MGGQHCFLNVCTRARARARVCVCVCVCVFIYIISISILCVLWEELSLTESLIE